MVDLRHMRSSMWPVDSLHSGARMAMTLYSDVVMLVRKLWSGEQVHKERRPALENLYADWNQNIATTSERVRLSANKLFSGNIQPSTPEKMARSLLTTLSRTKSIMLGTSVYLTRVLSCKRRHHGTQNRCTSSTCCALNNSSSSHMLWPALRACHYASTIICMSSMDAKYNWSAEHAGPEFHAAAKSLMDAWIELDHSATEVGVDAEKMTSKGGTGVIRTVHALLCHTPFLRFEMGEYISSSIFERMHISITKACVTAVQAIQDDERYSSRLLVHATSLALTSIIRDIEAYKEAILYDRPRAASSTTWRYIRFSQTPNAVENGVRLTHDGVWNLVKEDMAHKIRAIARDVASDDVEALAERMMQCGHEAHESDGGVLADSFCYYEFSSKYSLDDGLNCALTQRGKPSPPLPWLRGVKSGDSVIYRMSNDGADTAHAARVLGWLRTTFRTIRQDTVKAEVFAIVEFLQPETDAAGRDPSTTFNYTVTRLRQRGGSRRGRGERWMSFLPRASVWQRLPLTALDCGESTLTFPVFFKRVLESCADVKRIDFRP